MALTLSDETINKLVDQLISKGSDFAKTESEKQLRNTKDLLKNYRLLENHLDVDLPKLEDETPLSKYELSLYSLLGYRARSKEMIQFINQIIDRYHGICEEGTYEQHRRYKVIYNLYFGHPLMNRVQLAKLFNCDEKTIRRDEKLAIHELSIMLFGVDSLNDMSK
ncbi:hypothetical protein [Lentilactobacillus buchneri]|uniref:hypothetical protein n=1 Tax=Lentilactobacillus buchneri TaxID=1581 RepID=UPI0012922133|nr:hypothetical protein [Lentilactobacillus buchneri]MQM78851.1 hypothetical protein [Lentilactobacillus buchneri]MQM88842.1 hypothetical protein [Lentilactobacillus buchneri]MQN21054.1 hypothetical protein [Lentilactobacillus buchneri]